MPVLFIELPTRDAVNKAFGPNSSVFDYDYQEIVNSFDQLRLLKYENADIQSHPTILMKNALTLSNYYNVLQESGFVSKDLALLNHHIKILNKPIHNLKVLSYIPKNLNVPQQLAGYLNLDVKHLEFCDKTKLKDVRQAIINEYLKATFNVSQTELSRIFVTYPNMRHKSFKLMTTALGMLIDELGMSKERIIKHPYVLYTDPDNLRKIISEPSIGGIETRELLWRRPKIMMSSYQTLMKVQETLRMFGVPDSAVPRCIEIFTLSASTVYERLSEMRKIDEFSVLVNHPRVLRLVHYNSKALARLEYLRRMKVNCVSLHVLSSCSDYFERFELSATYPNMHNVIHYFLQIHSNGSGSNQGIRYCSLFGEDP